MYGQFLCTLCGKLDDFAYYSYADQVFPRCCGEFMEKQIGRFQNFHQGDGDFEEYYLETAAPDPFDPSTPMGRWIRTKADQKRYEKELDAEGKYIPTAAEASNKLGTRTRPTPTVKEERENIARFGPKYFDVKREEDKKKPKSE